MSDNEKIGRSSMEIANAIRQIMHFSNFFDVKATDIIMSQPTGDYNKSIMKLSTGEGESFEIHVLKLQDSPAK